MARRCYVKFKTISAPMLCCQTARRKLSRFGLSTHTRWTLLAVHPYSRSPPQKNAVGKLYVELIEAALLTVP